MFESRAQVLTDCQAYPRWLGDIGGTNARFGWQTSPNGAVEDVMVLPCAEFESLAAAAQAYLERTQKPRPTVPRLALPTPWSAMPLP